MEEEEECIDEEVDDATFGLRKDIDLPSGRVTTQFGAEALADDEDKVEPLPFG